MKEKKERATGMSNYAKFGHQILFSDVLKKKALFVIISTYKHMWVEMWGDSRQRTMVVE